MSDDIFLGRSGAEVAAIMNRKLPVGDNPLTPSEALGVAHLLRNFREGKAVAKDVYPALISILGPVRAETMIKEMELDYVKTNVVYADPDEDPEISDLSDVVMVCEVCEQQLNRFSTADDEVWVHNRAFSHYSHEPVPKLIPRAQHKKTQCDFCGLLGPLHWKYAGERLQTALPAANYVSDFGTVWGACEPCSTLLNNGDLEALIHRVMRVSPTLGKGLDFEEQKFMRARLLDLWGTFLPTVTEQIYVGPQREPAKLNPRMMPKLQAGLVRFWRNPTLADKFAVNRGFNGQILSLPGIHCGFEDRFSVQFQPDIAIPKQFWDNHVNHLTAGLEGDQCDLIWISRDFTQLAIMAGKDFDKLVVTREELPAKFGFMMFEAPIFELQRPGGTSAVRGITWTLVPDGIWVNLYFQGEEGDPTVNVEQMRAELGWLHCPNIGGGIKFGAEIELPDDDREYDFIRTVFAAWFLMSQPGVTESRPAPVDKKAARSFQRAHGRHLPDVRLVDLRRQPHRSGGDGPSREGRKLTVRVYRKGHWKRQAYGPKRGLRRTIYVSPYIAGPEGAPLKERPPVVMILR